MINISHNLKNDKLIFKFKKLNKDFKTDLKDKNFRFKRKQRKIWRTLNEFLKKEPFKIL